MRLFCVRQNSIRDDYSVRIVSRIKFYTVAGMAIQHPREG